MTKIYIIFMLSLVFTMNIHANELNWYSYRISNAKLLDFRWIDLDLWNNKKGLKIENTNVISTYLRQPIVKNYTQTNFYKKLIPAIEAKWYAPIFFDYADTWETQQLNYTFHHNQSYTLTNTAENRQVYIIKFYPVTPAPYKHLVFELPHKKCPNSQEIVVLPDYDVINLDLSSSKQNFINLTKQYTLSKRDYSEEFRDGSRCKQWSGTSWTIYSYYEAKIELDSQESINLYFSYNSLDYFLSDQEQEWNLHVSWYDYLFPLERSYLDFSNFEINTPTDYKIYNEKWEIPSENTFRNIRNKIFNIK